jgi:hypothetical protein
MTLPELRIYVMEVIQWITQLGPRWYKALGSALLVLLLILIYPFKTTTVPEWNLRVLDDGGAAVRKIKVTEHWQHYLLEASGHEDPRTTNEEGRVGFPARSIRGSLLRRLLARIGKMGKLGDPGRIDPYGSVVVWGSKDHETNVAVHREGGLPQAEITVRRVR